MMRTRPGVCGTVAGATIAGPGTAAHRMVMHNKRAHPHIPLLEILSHGRKLRRKRRVGLAGRRE